MQRNDAHALFLCLRFGCVRVLRQSLYAVYDLGIVFMQVVPVLRLFLGVDYCVDNILASLKTFTVYLKVLRTVEREAYRARLHDVQRLPLVAGGRDECVHLVHVHKGICALP